MNMVSFGSNKYDSIFYEKSHNSTRKSQNVGYSALYSDPKYDFDLFEPKTQPKKAEVKTQGKPSKKNNGLAWWQKLGVALGFVGVGAGSTAVCYEIANKDIIPDTAYYAEINDSEQLAYIESLYGTDSDLILAYNGVETAEDLVGKSEIAIPKGFDNLQEKIDELQEKLFDGKLTVEEKASVQDEINSLLEKQQKQKEVAMAYQDGKYVYFIMKESVNAEDFKDIYGIEDGALSSYNELSFDFVSVPHGPGEPDSHYKDYTGASLRKGETYKVKINNFV